MTTTTLSLAEALMLRRQTCTHPQVAALVRVFPPTGMSAPVYLYCTACGAGMWESYSG